MCAQMPFRNSSANRVLMYSIMHTVVYMENMHGKCSHSYVAHMGSEIRNITSVSVTHVSYRLERLARVVNKDYIDLGPERNLDTCNVFGRC